MAALSALGAFALMQLLSGHGFVSLLPLLLAWLVLPTAPHLDRRLAINIFATAGACALLSWVPAPGRPISRVAILVALTVGLAAWAAAREGWRHLVPTASRGDLLIGLAAVLGGAITLPMAHPGSADRAFAMLNNVRGVSGWDHAAHLSMFLTQRQNGVAPPVAQLLGHESAQYAAHYPQLFHGMLATLAGYIWGEGSDSVGAELIHYVQLQSLVLVLLSGGLTAACLHPLGSGKGFVKTFAALGVAGFVIGFPGSTNLAQGHLSFLLACAATAAVFLLCRVEDVERSPSLVFLWGATILLVSQWPLLLPLAFVGSARLLWRIARRSIRWPLIQLAVVLVTTALVVRTGLALVGPTAASVPGQLVATGEVVNLSIIAILGAPLMVVLFCWWSASSNRHDPYCRELVAAGVTALASAFALGSYQVATSGVLSYYFWKLGLGSALVVLVVALPSVCASLQGLVTPGGTLNRPRLLLTATLLLVVNALGLGFWAGTPSLTLAGQTYKALTQAADGSPATTPLLRAALATSPADAQNTSVVWFDATRQPALSSQWFHTLTSSRSGSADVDDGQLGTVRGDDSPGLARVAVAALEAPNRLVVTNDPTVCPAIAELSGLTTAARCRLVPSH
ncbi:hypothetical protein [Phycicoccus sp. Root101]|uniref:hypothetical protein n=1 Tax=Phycicoccus sp. Root101 TaxID=1736421 RepID=UPI000B10FF4A|nr:hypothetical protein [Phycicoccus sp. Root101]